MLTDLPSHSHKKIKKFKNSTNYVYVFEWYKYFNSF